MYAPVSSSGIIFDAPRGAADGAADLADLEIGHEFLKAARRRRPAPPSPAGLADRRVYGLAFAGAVAAFCLSGLFDGVTGQVLAVVGGATCGWSWLVARALFRAPGAPRPAWPLALVAAMTALGALQTWAWTGAAAHAALPRMIDNLGVLISSCLLLLAIVEPLRGLGVAAPRAERRFRVIFAAIYALVLAVAVVWVDGAPRGDAAARWGPSIKTGCALLALLGMAAALWYRQRHPLPDAAAPRRRRSVVGDPALGQRLLRAMADDGAYTRPDLKVADVARALGEAEYRVSECITGALGFRNFNHMVNHFRVEAAKRRLTDARFDHLPVLTIAFDCGFGSIGPFNRAFKAQTGETPKAFRQAARQNARQGPHRANATAPEAGRRTPP